MKKIMDWMTNKFAPAMNKLSNNPWISAVQESILIAMPIILIGSFSTVFNILRDFIPSMPDLSIVSQFSFGLLSLFLSYLVPERIMERKKHKKTAKQAGLAGIAFFLMICSPSFENGNLAIETSKLGNGGMIAALVAGLFVGAIMNQFAKHSFFKEDTAMPDFITVWFDTLIPITLVLVIGWILVFILEMNIFDMIYNIFSPLISIGQSFWGFVILNFIGYSFLYSFGISTWVIYPITSAICMQGLAANQAAVASGLAATAIHTSETTNLFLLGGGGCTLALGIMMLFAKSKKLKVMGKASLIPSLCNINEPLVYGAPIAFNPLLMIPMWIIGLIGPMLTYWVMSAGLVPIPYQTFGFWYLPFPFVAYGVTQSISGVIFSLAMFALSYLIYYPFFKVYDNQCLNEEKKNQN